MLLTEVLTELGVPDPCNVEELVAFGDSLYERGKKANLDDLQEIAQTAQAAGPEFAAFAEAAARAEDPRASGLLSVAADTLPRLKYLAFMDTADVILASPQLLASESPKITRALAERAEETRSQQGLAAYGYLETLTRLGLVFPAAKFRAQAFMVSTTLDDAPELLERLPRLVGLALDQWRTDDLTSVLSTLLEYPDARADSLFELGHHSLRLALEERSSEDMIKGFREARERFASVESLEEARDDATLFRSALDVVMAFSTAHLAPANDPTAAFSEMSIALRNRAEFSMRSTFGGWGAPRRQAEGEWCSLSNTLRAAIPELGKKAWREPARALSGVLAAYQASRSVSAINADGIRIILEPPIHAAFATHEGLFEHLRVALASGDVAADQLQEAQQLLESLERSEGSRGGDAMGKAWRSAPALAEALDLDSNPGMANELARAIDTAPQAVALLNDVADAQRSASRRSTDPVVDTLLSTVLEELDGHPDLHGAARDEFVELLLALLRFAADRADAGRETWAKDIPYLFPPKNGDNPFTEESLQKDVYKWLCNSHLRACSRLEERDVAAGRADISVTQTHRFVIEIKRELRNADRDSLYKAYGGQAAAYTVSGPRVSVAMVLDLTDHSQGVPSVANSVWVDEVVAGGEKRSVVMIVIRGNRPTPRETKAGTATHDSSS